MNSKENICAIIITYNPNEDIVYGIDSVIKQVDKIIIVDNGSKITSINLLKKIINKKNISLILNKDNLGIAEALNIGIKKAIEENYYWVLTLDQDSIPSENMIDIMFKKYECIGNKKSVMVLAAQSIEKGTERNIEKGRGEIEEVLTEITSGNLVKVEVFEKVGFFEEKLFIDLVDHEFCLRVNKNGFKIVKIVDAILFHSLGETKYYNFFGKKVSSSNHSELRRYYMARNRVYVWKKYNPIFNEWVKKDKKLFFNELIRIILFEENKINKLKMSFLGFKDGKDEIFGQYGGK